MLSFHPRQGDLSEAPMGGEVVVGAQRDHGLAGPELPVESALPALPRDDPFFRIEVEEHRMVVLLGQAVREFQGDFVVSGAMADEDGAHRSGCS